MNELTNHTDAFVHFKRSSWLTRLSNIKMILGFFVAFLSYVAIWILIWEATLCTATLGILPQLFIPMCLGSWLTMGFLSISVMRYVDQHLLGATKRCHTALEDRLIEDSSQCNPEDLEKLVTGSLKLKRITAADIYSRRLLAVRMTDDQQGAAKKCSGWIATTDCWASSEKYHKTFKYALIWRETRGVLTLTPNSLDFESTAFTFHCHPTQIVAIGVKRHPLWIKPIPLKFISITINENGCEHTFCITPSFGHTDSVSDCNRLIDTWMSRLQEVRSINHSLICN